MIVVISGKAGTGKSTVAKILQQRLGWERIYGGQIHRDIAREKGMTLEEYNAQHRTDKPENEKLVEERILSIINEAPQETNFIIESRCAWKLLPESFKVILTVDEFEAAKRIFHDLQVNPDRNQQMPKDIEDMLKQNRKRDKEEYDRYLKAYGIYDVYNPDHYDLTVDTTHIPAEDAAGLIEEQIQLRMS
ncbi:cytidylate kinase family protein [Candidatus Woesearchaeota archaeon]|nr:cytidylate kinase family protein [Candidatus Woesearchaeota archaeon]